jgi:3-hydroxyisobutyrate dehydrogenase
MGDDSGQVIGVLGLGRMGLPIAARLAAAGHAIVGFDVDPARRALAEERGVRTATDAGAVASSADVLVTVLPGPLELRAALLGDTGLGHTGLGHTGLGHAGPGDARAGNPVSGLAPAGSEPDRSAPDDGLLRLLRPGCCWLDLTSNDPRVAAEVARAASARGVFSAGAPMRGGPTDAEGGTLGFSLSGEADATARALPLLAALGDPGDVAMLGTDIRAGYTAKLLANTLWFGQVIAVTEALLLGQALGLDLATLRAALADGPGGSVFIDAHLDALLAGDYLESFGIDRVVEELETVRDLAKAARTPSELTGLVTRLHAEALERFGPVGGELLAAKLLEERAGATLRVPTP